MTNQSTIDKLIEMRLTAMADAFRNQTNDPTFKEIPFEDRFGMLVDIEFNSRKPLTLKLLRFLQLHPLLKMSFLPYLLRLLSLKILFVVFSSPF